MRFHVIRSNSSNLDSIQEFLHTLDPTFIIRPRISVMQRVGRKRRPKLITKMMYPGYAFVSPEAIPHLQKIADRWTHHFLKSDGQLSSVPFEQIEYSLSLERKSIVSGVTIPSGARVTFKNTDLQGLLATVQNSYEHYVVVWPDGQDFPLTCLISDVEIIK